LLIKLAVAYKLRATKEEKMPTSDIPWSTPVSVRLQSGIGRLFASVLDAQDFLENEWPIRSGAYHDAAIVSCRRALNKSTPPAVAREMFVAACLEAGLRTTGDAPVQPNYGRYSPSAGTHADKRS
jgi:hypothetical protein